MAIKYVYPTRSYAEVVIDATRPPDIVERDLFSSIKKKLLM
jgi:hypothetical protein